MFTIAAMSSGQENYYLQLAQESYYLEGGEPPGLWMGQGAQELGLKGKVERADLRQLFAGFGPHKEALVSNAGAAKRQVGWDMTLSVPKSVSVLWSQAAEAERQQIEAIVMGSAERLVGFMEDNIAHTRKGSGGVDVQQAKLATGAFLHHTSRAEEPQLHVHLVTPNAGLGDDGKWGALRSREDFYSHQRTLGALFRADVAHGLAELGAELEQDRFAFKVKGVSDELCLEQSTRRTEIEGHMAAQGTSSARAAQVANLATRHVKGHGSLAELQPPWTELNEQHGLTSEAVAAVLSGPSTALTESRGLPLAKTLEELTTNRSHFGERDFLRVLLESIQAEGRNPYDAVRDAREYLHNSPEVVHLGRAGQYDRFSSAELYRVEEKLLERAQGSAQETRHVVDAKHLDTAARKATLSAEQREAARHIVCEPGSIKFLSGDAGTGKTHTLGAARAAWAKAGYEVVGCALAGKAAKELEKGSGIKSRTVASLLYGLDKASEGVLGKAKANISPGALGAKLRQNLSLGEISRHVSLDAVFTRGHRAVQNKPLLPKDKPLLPRKKNGKRRDPQKLTPKSVVVLDEAAMLGTRDFARLFEHIKNAGAKLVCVGDNRQIASIEAGGMFQALSERLGTARLQENRRQHEEWMRDSVRQFRDGDVRGALSQYAAAEKLEVRGNRDQAKHGLIDAWLTRRTSDLKGTLILAGTNQDVDELNLAAQRSRRDAGELGRKSTMVGEERMFEGDRVLFTKNSRLYGIANGDFATVEAIRSPRHPRDSASLSVRLDSSSVGSPERVTVSLADYHASEVRLGYASTTHKSQGSTVDRTFVLAGGWMQDSEATYVQMSRHREACHIFVSEPEAGEDLCEMVRAMKKSRAQELAHVHEQSLERGF